MKTATLPSLRIEPELRTAAESVLRAGETLSSFMEVAVRESIDRRRARAEFVARGLISRDQSQRNQTYHLADDVHAELEKELAAARTRVRG